MSFLNELKRRNVLRVGAAYVVTAWLVVQVVETLFPVYGLSDAAIRTVVNILAVGLVPALVLAWVFEWTPEGLKRDTETDHDAPSSVRAAKRLDRIILAVLAVALGYFAFDKFVLDPQREARLATQQQAELEQARAQGIAEGLQQSQGEASIAVLAFADLSPGGDQRYLSDGIAEDILNLLQHMPELDVRSRTSAFRFKGKDVSIPEIARLLAVDHVLEGSVRRIGDRIRITAQLIDARTDSHIWSENFDRATEDVFAIMDEISLATAEQVGIELLSEPPRAEHIDADAYFLYLRGRDLVTYYDDVRAADYFEQALAIEPDYVDALLGAAMAYFELSKPHPSIPDEKIDENRRKYLAAWNRARELDPEHPVLLVWDAFEAVFGGDYPSAARLIESALEADPVNWDVVQAGIIFSYAIRRLDLALHLAEGAMLRFRARVPDSGTGTVTLGIAQMMQGKYEAALEQFELWAVKGGQQAWWGPLMVRALQGENVSDDLDRLEQSDEPREKLAEVSAVAGDTQRAFRLLDQIGAEGVTGSSFQWRFVNSRFFADLHGDPRWAALEERAGLAPHQLAEIRFNPSLPSFGLD